MPDRLAGPQRAADPRLPGRPGRRLPDDGDPEGDGALRLTSNGGFSSGFILYQDALPLTAGLDIRFSFFAYNGSGADGFSFFIADGAAESHAAGRGRRQPRLRPAERDRRAWWAATSASASTSTATSPTTARTAAAAARRNPPDDALPRPRQRSGDRAAGTTTYCLLATEDVGANGSLDKPGATQPRRRRPSGSPHHRRPAVDRPDAQVTGLLKPARGDELHRGVPPAAAAEPAADVQVRLRASTGGSTNIHEIRALDVESINPLPRLELAKRNNGPYVTGGSGTFTLTASHRGRHRGRPGDLARSPSPTRCRPARSPPSRPAPAGTAARRWSARRR